MHPVLLPIDAIIADQEVQSRAASNKELANEYSEAIKDGQVPPPVVVFYDGEKYWLADGFHRLQAHILAGRSSIRVEIKNGTRRDAILFSAGCNSRHGLRRNWDDVRHTITKLLMDNEWRSWSNKKIGDACNVSNTYVRLIRAEMTRNGSKFDVRRKSSNGRIMDTSRIGKPWQLSNKPRPVSDQIDELSLSMDKIVDYSPFDPDKLDELDKKITKVREELKALGQTTKSKQRELLGLRADRRRLTSLTPQ